MRTAADAQAALVAIAEDKPDVIALEPNLGGATGGKDIIHMIKASVEWEALVSQTITLFRTR